MKNPTAPLETTLENFHECEWKKRAEKAEAQVEQMSYWLVNASVCPECGNSPLRANYSAGKATLRYCDRGGCGCGWKQAAIKGEK